MQKAGQSNDKSSLITTGRSSNGGDRARSKDRKAQVLVMESDERKRKLVGLWLGGMESKEIVRRIGCDPATYRTVLAAYKVELAKLDPDIIKSMLSVKITALINASDITAMEHLTQFIDLQNKRDGMVSELAQIARDAKDINKVKIGKAVKGLKDYDVTLANRELRDIAAAWMRGNKDFVDLIDRMGVPRVPGVLEKKEPTDVPILLENTEISKADATKAMKSSLKRQLRALDEKEKEDASE